MSSLSPTNLKENYQRKVNMIGPGPRAIYLAIQLPHGGLEHTVVTANLKDKIDYICANYTNDFFLKTNNEIRIVCAVVV